MRLRFLKFATTRRGLFTAGSEVDLEATGWSDAEAASAVEAGSCAFVEAEGETEGAEGETDPEEE